MIRIAYFEVSRHCLPGPRDFLLRFVVQRDEAGGLIDSYYEYGLVSPGRLALFHDVWSVDPEALVDRMPRRFQFAAAMDVRQFVRQDEADALAGSLMADDIELLFSQLPATMAR